MVVSSSIIGLLSVWGQLFRIKALFTHFIALQGNISTPKINSKLATPFNKQSVVSSVKFKEEYSEVKCNLRKMSGGLGKEAYQADKKRRNPKPFTWKSKK